MSRACSVAGVMRRPKVSTFVADVDSELLLFWDNLREQIAASCARKILHETRSPEVVYWATILAFPQFEALDSGASRTVRQSPWNSSRLGALEAWTVPCMLRELVARMVKLSESEV